MTDFLKSLVPAYLACSGATSVVCCCHYNSFHYCLTGLLSRVNNQARLGLQGNLRKLLQQPFKAPNQQQQCFDILSRTYPSLFCHHNLPVPESSKHVKECIITGFSPNDIRVLLIRSTVWRGQWWNVDWVANRLVTWRINHVAQCLFGILYAATLRIAIPQVYQLLQLSGPQATNTFSIHLQYTQYINN